jgi:hypothetical protein
MTAALRLPETEPARRPTWRIAVDIAQAFDPETGEVDAARVDALSAELGDKAEAIHHVLGEFAAQAEACKLEAARVTERARLLAKRGERLEAYLLGCMTAAGLRKLETPLVTVTVRAGSPRVDVTDAAALPAQYMRTPKPEPDKVAIKAALASGTPVPGAALARGAESVQFR